MNAPIDNPYAPPEIRDNPEQLTAPSERSTWTRLLCVVSVAVAIAAIVAGVSILLHSDSVEILNVNAAALIGLLVTSLVTTFFPCFISTAQLRKTLTASIVINVLGWLTFGGVLFCGKFFVPSGPTVSPQDRKVLLVSGFACLTASVIVTILRWLRRLWKRPG